MNLYRITFTILFLSALAIVASHRIKAQVERGSVSEVEENRAIYFSLRLTGLAIWGSVFLYMLNPNWLAWSALLLPVWLRWTGAAIAAGALPLAYSATRAIGSNVTRTVVTREEHELVTWGPYRYVRHPLYTVGMMLFVGLGLLAANAFMLAGAAVGFVLINLRLPQEEAGLIDRFGDDYREYMQRTGRFIPRPNLPV